MMTYSIHDSRTGETLISAIELAEDVIETLSIDSAEGHFRASQIEQARPDESRMEEVEALGDVSVYALLH